MPLSFASCEILSVARRGIAKAAAYAERRIIADEAGAVLYRPRRHDDAVAGFTLLPRDASPRFADPRTLWDAVEHRGRSGRSRVVGLAFVLGLPREEETTLPECLVLVRRFAEILRRGRLPVRADIHRVLDGDGHVLHRHAHLTVGLYAVAGDVIGRALERRWLPVVRGRLVHALDWSSIWAQVQTDVFRERDLDLAVPPAPGLAEPKVVGRPKRGTKAALAGRTPGQVRDEVRAERARLVGDPGAVLRCLTRNRLIVSRATLRAFLAGAGLGPEAVTELAEAVLAHEDAVDLSVRDTAFAGEQVLTSRTALDRAATILSHVDGMADVTATVASTSAGVLVDLQELVAGIAAAPASTRRLVVVWSDAGLRREMDDAVSWPRGTRQIAARHLSELDRRDAVALRWSADTIVLVISADRLDDVEVGILVGRAARAGVGLRLGVALDGPVPRSDSALAAMLVERVLDARLPFRRDDTISLQILRQRLSWDADRRDAPSRQADAPAVLIRSQRQRQAPAEPHDPVGPEAAGPAAPIDAIMTPREAWTAPPEKAELVVCSASDWLWAGPLLRQHPHLDVRFDIEDADRVYEAVVDRMRGRLDALRRLIGPIPTAASEATVAPGIAPSSPADPTGMTTADASDDERDGLDRDTDLDAEAAADNALALDPDDPDDEDAYHHEGDDDHELDGDERQDSDHEDDNDQALDF